MNSTVTQAIKTRRSIRKFTSQPVSRETIETLLDLAQSAPSSSNVQPWRFAVVTQDELKVKLQAAAFGQTQITSAPATIVLYTDMKAKLDAGKFMGPNLPEQALAYLERVRAYYTGQTEEQLETFGAGQSYIALAYLMLAAHEHGLGTVPMLGFNPQEVKSLLGLPEHTQVAALLPVGYPDEEGRPSFRFDAKSMTTWF